MTDEGEKEVTAELLAELVRTAPIGRYHKQTITRLLPMLSKYQIPGAPLLTSRYPSSLEK